MMMIFKNIPISMGNKKLITLKLKRGVSKKLLRIMMLILKKVPAINSEVYTAFRSSSKVVMRRAAACCLVFSMFTSLLCKEKRATSAPEVIKLSNNKTSSNTIFKTVPCGEAKSKWVICKILSE